MEFPFRRIAIIGVGLIGGSLGMAFRRASRDVRVLGFGRSLQRLELARQLGAVDDLESQTAESTTAATMRDCDLVILATPIEQILAMFDHLGENLSPGTLITDVGSTKRQICQNAWEHLPAHIEFIGGHPIAGREVGGVENGSATLFEKAAYVLCPRAGMASVNVQKMVDAVTAIGATPAVMSPDEHDAMMARLSHMPQLLSTALANVSRNARLEISGSGFRDMMRLAGSPYSVWKGILETNSDHVAAALEEMILCLEKMRADLSQTSDADELADAFESAQKMYERLSALK